MPAIGRRTILRRGLTVGSLLALPTAILNLPVPALAALSTEDMADLARIEQYMDSVITMQARFQQVEPDGRLAFGTIYLQKPGRLRVEYDRLPIRVVADGTLISYYDMELDQLSQLPLRQSTAWFLVRHPIDLSDGITVSQIDRSPGGLQLQMFQTDEPEAGSVSLIFYENPLTLAQWTVTDAQNKEVRVGLTNVRTGIDIPNEKFATPRPCRQTDSCIGGGNRGGGRKD
ncbi:MAG: LolA family protein [Geminicoccales bacterium]